LSRDVNNTWRCDVNKDGGGVNDLLVYPNFELCIMLKLYFHVIHTALGEAM